LRAYASDFVVGDEASATPIREYLRGSISRSSDRVGNSYRSALSTFQTVSQSAIWSFAAYCDSVRYALPSLCRLSPL